MSILQEPNDDDALAALAAAALHPFKADDEISEEEILRVMSETRPLTETEQQALARIQCDPRKWNAEQPDSTEKSGTIEARREVAAMHREKGDQELSPETMAKIAQRREEIRAQVRKKRGCK